MIMSLNKIKIIAIACGVLAIVVGGLSIALHISNIKKDLATCQSNNSALKLQIQEQNNAIDKASAASELQKTKAAYDYKAVPRHGMVSVHGSTMDEVDKSILESLKNEEN